MIVVTSHVMGSINVTSFGLSSLLIRSKNVCVRIAAPMGAPQVLLCKAKLVGMLRVNVVP